MELKSCLFYCSGQLFDEADEILLFKSDNLLFSSYKKSVMASLVAGAYVQCALIKYIKLIMRRQPLYSGSGSNKTVKVCSHHTCF